MTNNERWVYVASFEYETPRLSRAPILKETEKTYTPDREKAEYLIGLEYVGRSIKKGPGVFVSLEDALNYLIMRGRQDGEKLLTKIGRIDKSVAALSDTLAQWQKTSETPTQARKAGENGN